jgi:hypothetical protein
MEDTGIFNGTLEYFLRFGIFYGALANFGILCH